MGERGKARPDYLKNLSHRVRLAVFSVGVKLQKSADGSTLKRGREIKARPFLLTMIGV